MKSAVSCQDALEEVSGRRKLSSLNEAECE